MLIPGNLFTVREYDATFVVTPTSRFGHDSDSVLAIVEMLVVNDEGEDVDFPFFVLNVDSGDGAENKDAVAPHVVNGSREVAVAQEEINENALAEIVVQRAQAAGESDEADLERIRQWGRQVLGRAERTHVGRTKIKPGEARRIILQQRLRVRPNEQGQYVFETIAPSPIATLAAGGRVSVVTLLPWEDEDVRPTILTGSGLTTPDFEFEQGRIKQRQWVAWHWKFDPIFRLVYQYQ